MTLEELHLILSWLKVPYSVELQNQITADMNINELLDLCGWSRNRDSHEIMQTLRDLSQALDDVHKEKLQIATIQTEDYPPYFRELADPPWAFTYIGAPVWMEKHCVAIVGARELDARLSQWFEDSFGPALEKNDLIVVSGGARGADQLAHSLAFWSGRSSLCWLPSGLGKVYPKSLNQMKPLFLNQGAMASAYPPRKEMRKHHFHERNRLIVGMAPLTLMLQASLKSGSRLSGQIAVNEGREVACPPGLPFDPRFSGNIDILRSGGHLLADQFDIAALISRYCSGLTSGAAQ